MRYANVSARFYRCLLATPLRCSKETSQSLHSNTFIRTSSSAHHQPYKSYHIANPLLISCSLFPTTSIPLSAHALTNSVFSNR